MRVFYSPSMAGFYTDEINGDNYPSDAVEISEEEWRQLLEEASQGRIIVADSLGKPVAMDRPPESVAQMASRERAWRDAEVSETEWLVSRHRDEQYMQLATTLTAEQFAELLMYRQALRDWPQTEAFPDSTQRPVAPPWIAEQTH
ncbi:phage tail protein [Pseudomonas sp. S31]|uniref:phage tail assembly chaperone n=1 Tax=Pseudomonas sp. S31 TaxID=1564473 RepID=UPI001913DA3A|nr:phage tail assembly chaperone [Pseudomonas sp. S31]MBK5003279.1 phage tail protein [Pseudomonas sp. S31]